MRRALALVLVVAAACSSSPGASAPPSPSTTVPPASTTTAPEPAIGDDVLLVWSPGGLPDGFTAALRSLPGVDAVASVLGDVVGLADAELEEGYRIPVDVLAYDCEGATAVLPAEAADAVCALGDDEVLLGETSARLRGVEPGGTVALAGGPTLTVSAVVGDDVFAAAELVVARSAAAGAGVDTERFALVRRAGERADVEAAIRAVDPSLPLRVRSRDEVPWFRHADAVLPQALVKERFGELALRRSGGGAFTLAPGWRDGAIVTEELPVLGAVPCHRLLVPTLRAALGEAVEAGLLSSVDRSASGCHNPRTIAGTDQPSRHTWGIAVDLVGTEITPELVALMDRHGLTWGGHWLTPDPIHFEYVRPPA